MEKNSVIEHMFNHDIDVEWFTIGKGIKKFRDGEVGKFNLAGKQYFEEHKYVHPFRRQQEADKINRSIDRSRNICIGFGGQGVPDYAIFDKWTDITTRTEAKVYATHGSYALRSDYATQVVGYIGKHSDGSYYFRKLKNKKTKRPLYQQFFC